MGVSSGICGEVGELNGQRLALPRAFERVYLPEPSEKRLWEALLKHAHQELAADEILVVDAGVKIAALHKAQIERYVVRLATNVSFVQPDAKLL
ncbi:MAG TPA: hypothetical protein PLJ78_17645 [Anaerolineae bacterium]|nr:hypothetical protein [Anaerolineae bacterium]HQK15756.1 hypothetical protein [Anaerolineae bacterium]